MLIYKLEEKIKVRLMLLFLFILNVYWFSVFKFKTIMGDDLFTWINFKNNHLSFWHYVFLQEIGDKYRPVYNLVQFGLYKFFGMEYILYFYVNILFNFIIVIVFFKLIQSVTKNNIYVSFLFSALFITARFAYYEITMLIGIMEALSLLILLLMIYNAILFYKKDSLKHLYLVIFYDLLIVFTHERYLVLTLLLVLMVLFKKMPSADSRKKIILIGTAVVPFILNIVVKKILGASVLSGTGGTSLGFNPARIIKFIGNGIMNMFGFNIGPEYLSGIPFENTSHWTQLLTILLALLIILIVVVYGISVKNAEDKKKHLIIVALALTLIGSLIFSASITIRQEFRWLYAPYSVTLIFMAYMWNHSFKQTYWKNITLILIVIITINNDLYYKGYTKNVFFNYSQSIADSAFNETVKKYGEHLGDYTIYIEKSSDVNWPLLDDQLFKVYSGNDGINVKYVDKLPESKSDKDIFLKLDWITKKMITIP